MSSIVSNPYSFNISKNTGFSVSGSIQVMLPNTNQSLYSDSDNSSMGNVAYIIEDIELKIPNGVNVISVDANARVIMDLDSFNHASISITNMKNNKIWASESGEKPLSNLQLSVHKYIGVTPGKIYKLRIDLQAHAEEYGDSDVHVNIYYSALINQQNPDILDY